MADPRPQIRLRILTSEDAEWVTSVDRDTASPLAPGRGWNAEKLAAELDEGLWAAEDRMGWGVFADGEPAGFALVTDLTTGDGQIDLRISSRFRGKGIGREVLRRLADHHFAASPELIRLAGRAHEQNVPMQRAFNAAGFRMEARYRDSVATGDGRFSSEWGYGLTRADWEDGLHRADEHGYNLHGLIFRTEQVLDGDDDSPVADLEFKFLQEGRRAIAKYDGQRIHDGELAGILADDVLIYRYIHEFVRDDGSGQRKTGSGRSRVQRRQDGRLEVVNEWSGDDGRHGTTFLVERREV